MKHPFSVLFLSLSLLPPVLHGAGMDCRRGASVPEKAICTDDGLRGLDAHLGKVYAQALRYDPASAKALRDSQRQWLQRRNDCGEERACLEHSQRQRIDALLAIQTPAAKEAVVAMGELQRTLEVAARENPEFPLERALAAFPQPPAATDFANRDEDGGGARFPSQRPDGVSTDEWSALLHSEIETEGENGNVSYRLLDLDGDGLRDLVIDAYSGGTGLYSHVGVRRRQGGHFVGNQPSWEEESYLYSLNGRGANQDAYWLTIRGRIYVLYRDSRYAVDNLYLLDPLERRVLLPRLALRYRYTLDVPRTQENPESGLSTSLEETLRKELLQALDSVDTGQAHDTGPSSEPLCPIPPSAPEASRGEYHGFGPGHYSMEIVANLAVWLGGECHVGQMIDWFGSYDRTSGLSARLLLRKPAGEGSERDFQVSAKRRFERLSSSIDTLESSND